MLTLKKALVFLFVALGLHSKAQIPAASDSLQVQAKRMVNALTTGDYNTFIHYVHPKIVQISGGADAMKQMLTKMSRQMNVAGASFQSISLDSLSKFVKAGLTVQATIRQHTSMTVPGGRTVATSTLIGMSSDNGAHWRFIDTNGKTLSDVRQVLPNLSTALVIPPRQAPVHVDQ